jgi:diaminopimelate epimerase
MSKVQLPFTKMHGLGNDFMLLDRVQQDIPVPNAQVAALADRRTGIGFDQLLVIEPASSDDFDFNYRIFNADGSESEHCGNGSRCVAKYLRDHGLSNKQRITLGMPTGSSIQCEVLDNGLVTVNMGAPILAPADIPFVAERQALTYPLQVGEQTLEISAISMGNPHAVLLVEDVDTAPVSELGPCRFHASA